MLLSRLPGSRTGRRRQWRTKKQRQRPDTLYSCVTTTAAAAALLLFLVLGSIAVAALRPQSLPRLSMRDYAHVEDVSRLLDTLELDPRPLLDYRQPDSLLAKILVPRVPDSPANAAVRAALLAPFKGRAAWHIEEHTFIASTPEGEKHMTNLILTYNINAPRRLVLAAHHDSKVSPAGFVGATDSAVPCAIIVDTALSLEKAMEQQKNQQKQHERGQQTGLQLLFFDGEEAYVQWTQSDSVYGSRALASEWTRSFFTPTLAKRRNAPGYATMRTIDAIEHFVLLDLLGTPHPIVPSYFTDTHWLYQEARSAEQRLAAAGRLFPKDKRGALELPPPRSGGGGADTTALPGASGSFSFFPDRPARFGGIDDDHRPFLQSGVPILHLIPSPFPLVWHRMSDDASALDWPTIHAWAMIMRVLVVEYFGLHHGTDSAAHAGKKRDDSFDAQHVIEIGRLPGGEFVSNTSSTETAAAAAAALRNASSSPSSRL